MRRRRRSIASAAALVFCAAVAAFSGPADARWTAAAWSDAHRVSASVSAGALETPTITSCEVRTLLNLGLVFTGVTITWTSAYEQSGVELRISGRTIPSSAVTPTGSGPYVYTATLSDDLLSSLLGGLLGSSNPVEVTATHPGSAWVSPAATRTLSVGGLLGLAGRNECT
ncbi:hypothetical protein [Microbacterium soli]|uniref:Uncharacterized protein n=1 Tax=Microbacterium soli TaxID=446075 RepID=A0ABP7NES6_9MICO